LEVLIALGKRAGVPVYIPSDVAATCCGTPFSSKGFADAHKAINNASERCWSWSEQGRLPVVIDTGPETLRPDDVPRLHRVSCTTLCSLNIHLRADFIARHPVCSITQLGLTPKLEAIAKACSASVLATLAAGCCAFAGDRGFLLPELTASATRLEAAEVKAKKPSECYSSSRTCEIGMTRATGHVHRSFLYLLEKATR
jgi:D-lactate dehydrogenase